MPCDTQTLLQDSACLSCDIPPGLVGYVALALMCAIRDGDTMACDSQTLLAQARCLQCDLTPGMLGFAQLAVLCDIAAAGGGGGGGGGGQVMQYTSADPNGEITPTNQNEPAWAYKDDGSLPSFSWNTTTHVWQ